MKINLTHWFLLGMIFLLAACSGNEKDPTSTVLPTIGSPPPGSPTVNTTPVATVARATLPPTWTPAPPTATRVFDTPRFIPATPTVFIFEGNEATVEAICFDFYAMSDLNLPSERISPNTQISIFWHGISVPGYTYRVQLLHPDGSVLVDEVVDDQQFTFLPLQLYVPGYTLGWEVQPQFAGEDACYAISGEIYVNPQ